MDYFIYPKVSINDEDVITVRDASGNAIDLVEYDGEFLSRKAIEDGRNPDVRTNIPNIIKMEVRPDDVFLLAYPKAGTHWASEIIYMLLKHNTEYNEKPKESAMLPYHNPEYINKLASPRIINSHSYFRHLPRDIIKRRNKIIFMNRNPKDICVSFYNHFQHVLKYPGSFSDFLTLFTADKAYYSPWHLYMLDWEKTVDQNPELDILFINYEDLHKNPVFEIERLAVFLNVENSKEFYTKVTKLCSFTHLKQAYRQKGHSLGDFMFRKGGVGDWRNWFTVKDNDTFDHFLSDRMKNSSWKFTYNFLCE